MSVPETVDTSSQAVSVGIKPQLYKCLLYRHAQKIWKQLPMYQTINEGSDHSPKFRSSVWVDGIQYTSPNTFQQKKMAEMDASRVAFFGSLLKLKNEASNLVREDKHFCKSIFVAYAARMNIQKPIYQTIQLDTPIPVFCSSVVFNDVSCTGENSRSKKEAEQSAARAVILKILDSESGSIMSEIIKCNFKRYYEMMGIQSVHDATREIVPAGSENDITTHTTYLCVDLNQKHTEEVSSVAVIQMPTVSSHTPVGGTHNEATCNLANSQASSVAVDTTLTLVSSGLVQANFVGPISGKKRKNKKRKNGRKKTRFQNQAIIPAIHLNQVPTFSAQ